MARSLTLLIPLALICAGCMTKVRNVGSDARPPRAGVHLVYAPNGQLLQKTIWRAGKVVSVWEYHRGDVIPGDVVDALGWDDSRLPPPRWTQTIASGRGKICTFDQRGILIGWEEYWDGIYVRGAH
jgi:hypothetical protein